MGAEPTKKASVPIFKAYIYTVLRIFSKRQIWMMGQNIPQTPMDVLETLLSSSSDDLK